MKSTDDLLRAVIQSSNRTTRAVRALVRFLLIQLSALTLAILLFQLGVVTQDASRCAMGICPPSPGWTIVAGLVWIAGIVWSSIAGWSELEKSDPSKSDREVEWSANRAEKAAREAPSERYLDS